MFGIGGPEMIAIFIIALIVFGPKKLPELGKSLGRGIREFNKAKNDLKATWDEQIREAETHLQDVKETIHEPIRESLAAVNEPYPVHENNLHESTPADTVSHGAHEDTHEPPHSEPPPTNAGGDHPHGN